MIMESLNLWRNSFDSASFHCRIWDLFLDTEQNSCCCAVPDEAWTELRTVTWPEKDETIRSTVVVIGVTLFIAFMLATYDFVWTKVASETLFGTEQNEEEKG